jgi:hypothetical protein
MLFSKLSKIALIVIAPSFRFKYRVPLSIIFLVSNVYSFYIQVYTILALC